MENKSSSSLVPGFGLSFLVVSILNGILMIVKESNEGLRKWMAGLLGHHWITHGVFVIILFFVLGWLLSRVDYDEKWYGAKTAVIVLVGAVLGSGIIVFSPLF
ncbi:MAG TPA: hypothetical protein VMU10_02930 [Desulfomonilia bacterium]|nr:hypothetical protein [Desulfomonilia bacterium]